MQDYAGASGDEGLRALALEWRLADVLHLDPRTWLMPPLHQLPKPAISQVMTAC